MTNTKRLHEILSKPNGYRFGGQSIYGDCFIVSPYDSGIVIDETGEYCLIKSEINQECRVEDYIGTYHPVGIIFDKNTGINDLNYDLYTMLKLLKERDDVKFNWGEYVFNIPSFGQREYYGRPLAEMRFVWIPREEDLEKSFEVLKNNLSIKIGDTSLVDRKFLDFKKVQETGTALNKSLLSLYLIYSNLLSQESKILFPIAIDSFIKNEISDKNEKKMFLAVQDDFVSLDNQTFFSVIKKNMDHFAERRSRVTLLTKPLLKQEMFEELQSELIKEGE